VTNNTNSELGANSNNCGNRIADTGMERAGTRDIEGSEPDWHYCEGSSEVRGRTCIGGRRAGFN